MAANYSNFDFNKALAQINANPYSSGWGDLPSANPLANSAYRTALDNGVKPSSYYWSPTTGGTPGQGAPGYWIEPTYGTGGGPLSTGGDPSAISGYNVAQAKWTPDGRPGVYANTPYDVYNPAGQFTGTGQYGSNVNPDDESWKQFGIAAAMMAGPFAAAIGGAGAGAGAVGAGAGGGGAGATGAGMLGDATAAGYGGLDATGAATLGGGASIPGVGGVGGAGFLGDATAAGYGGLDAASTATMGGGASLSGAGEAAGATGLAGAAGGGGPGVTPPNPYYAAPSTGGLSSVFGGSGTGGFNWGSLVGPAASLVGGAISAGASKSAADAQQASVDKAIALNEPFRVAGVNATNRLQELLGTGGDPNAAGYGSEGKNFSAADFQSDPGYQFRLQQGQQALTRQLSANGSLYSGKAMKDMNDYVQGQASQDYQNAYNRFQTDRSGILNPLQAMAGQGQSASNTTGNYVTQGGNAQAAGIVGSSNALASGLTNAYGAYSQNALMNLLLQNQAARQNTGIYGAAQ